MAEDIIEYNVVVVGAGNAACSAALAALDQGARVGILEKAPGRERGGNSMLTGHMRFVFNGIEDLRPMVRYMSDADLHALLERMQHRTEAEIWDDFMRVTNSQSDQELLQTHVAESLETIQWLCRKGHDWVPTGGVGDNILSLNGGGYGLQQRNFAFLEKGGAHFHYDTAATELIENAQGTVTGVRALTPAGYKRFAAGSVVLACGGFEANAEMRARYLGPSWDTVHVRGVPYNTGDGLRMALAIGAMSHGSWTTCHASPQDIALPLFTVPSSRASGTGDNSSRYMYPYSIMVNINGERFVDEADDTRGRTYAKMGRAVLAQPGGIAFQIMDAKIRRMNLYYSTYNRATTAKADTLEQLAEALDINAGTLVHTVRTFNAAICTQKKYDPNKLRLDGRGTVGITPPKSNYALSIDEPPFEAWPVRCGITFTFGGLKVDATTCQVQHVAGRPLPGLYCAGEMMGGLFHGNYPSGSGMMAGATFGRLAGTHAAREALARRSAR